MLKLEKSKYFYDGDSFLFEVDADKYPHESYLLSHATENHIGFLGHLASAEVERIAEAQKNVTTFSILQEHVHKVAPVLALGEADSGAHLMFLIDERNRAIDDFMSRVSQALS